MFERASIVELAQLAEVLAPPSALGPYLLTGLLASSSSALIFTATHGLFEDVEGVLKLTTSHHAARLRAELDRLVRCADGGVNGVIRPAMRELDWLPVPELMDAHVAVMALPFLSGGDLYAVRRARGPSPGLTREVALTLAATMRHLLELAEPMVHGSLSLRKLVLPRPDADLSQLTLIDFGDARDVGGLPPEEVRRLCEADVMAFGGVVLELTQGSPSGLGAFAESCAKAKYTSMADRRLWRDLERAAKSGGRGRWSWPW